MYSPEEFLAALEQATPESKSKAIYALQEALGNVVKQRDTLLSASKAYLEAFDQATGTVYVEPLIRKAVKCVK